MIRLKYLPILLLLLLTSCFGSGSIATWTIMVYMDGDNNLGAILPNDLYEMTQVGSTREITIIVQTDTQTATAKRYKVEKNGVVLLQDIGEANMADPATLKDFVSFAASNYPSTYYALILWDHGNGWKSPSLDLNGQTPVLRRSIFIDATNNATTPTLNAQVSKAIADGASSAGISIDVLGIDACMMATIEAAYEFRKSAWILVASQESVQANGWNYTDLLTRLTSNPYMPPEWLAWHMVESYRQYAESAAYGFGDQTISAMRLGPYVEAVATETDVFAQRLMYSMTNPGTRAGTLGMLTYARTVENTSEFTASSSPATYVDLYEFDMRIEGPGTALQTAIANMTINEYHGTKHANAHGMSIVFFDLPRALGYSTPVYDPDYRNYNFATGIGNRGDFIMNYNWDEMMHLYFTLNYPALTH